MSNRDRRDRRRGEMNTYGEMNAYDEYMTNNDNIFLANIYLCSPSFCRQTFRLQVIIRLC